MSEPGLENRLGDAGSPYLRQHADNPVAWQPWDREAFELAERRDVPIFLSIGYAACHWCHVMAEESFEDEAVAEVLNREYVPIKVDREERPDVDSVYMTACQLVRGGGGWPLSVWLTPDRDPFHVATYLPKDPDGGRSGFLEVLNDISAAWEDADRRRELESKADQLSAAIEDEVESVPDQRHEPTDDLLDDAVAAAVRSADRGNGGFGSAPKFPQPRRIRLLFRDANRTDDRDSGEVAVAALDAMASGGLYDHLGGGFHRYCTDEDWTVPHYEKMLYDNAELPLAYLDGFRVTGDERYRTVVAETLDFVDRELGHPDGGFYSTLAARSGDREGDYYTWTPETVRDAIQAHPTTDSETVETLALDRWGVTPEGNTDEVYTVLTRSASTESLAEEYGLSVSTVETHLETARTALLQARETRDRPPRDEKVLAGWNGLAITAYAEAGLTLDASYTDRAVDALQFIQTNHWDGDRLDRRYHHGDVGIPGYLEDYAFLARGALACYEATADIDHLAFAIDLADALIEQFWDQDSQTLYYTANDAEPLLARPQELQDQSTPASTGVAVDVLTKLDHVAPNRGFGDVASTVIDTHGTTLEQAPLRHVSLVQAATLRRRGPLEVTTVGDIPPDWTRTIAGTPNPDRVHFPRPADAETLGTWVDTLGLDTAPPVWADRGTTDGDPTAYVCRRSCSPPIHDRDDLEQWLQEYA